MARRNFSRPSGKRRYKKLFIIATEGKNTERQYLNSLNNDNAIVRVKCIKHTNHKSDPENVLKRMKAYLKEENFHASDEAWLVIDKDDFLDKQLQELYNWSDKSNNYHVALSNPKFEYWLLLHFEEGDAILSPKDCIERLRKYLPAYDKNINSSDFNKQIIRDAIRRAKLRHANNSSKLPWPDKMGSSTVYVLVDRILQGQGF